jgi:hypothetical protein
MPRKSRPLFVHELKRQDSAVVAVMEYYEVEMTREEYVLTNYLGGVQPDESIPMDVEATFPEQFRRETLHFPSMTEELQ